MQPVALRVPRVDVPTYTLEWSENIKNINYVPEARHSHGACVIANKMYAFAGHHSNEMSLSNTICLDLELMVWTEIKSALASPRKGVPLTSWGNRLFSFGGWCMGPNMTAVYSNELLTLNLDMPHPTNNLLNSNLSNLNPLNSNVFDAVPQWFTTRTTGTPPSARWGHTLTTVGNQIYLFGGCVDKGPTNEFYAYDITLNKWNVVPVRGPSPNPRYNHSALAYDHYLIVFGGVAIFDDKNVAYYNDVWIFDTKTSEWWNARVNGNPPSQRCGHAMTILDLSTVNANLPANNVSITIFGGFQRTNIVNDLHIMIIDLNNKEVKWLPSEVSPHAVGMKFYRADKFQIILRDDWKTPTPRYGHTLCTYQNKIILFGGGDNSQSLFDTKVLTLTTLNPLNNNNANPLINKIPGVPQWSPPAVKKANSLPESLDPEEDIALHQRVVSLAASLPAQIQPPAANVEKPRAQPNVFDGIQFHDLGEENNNNNNNLREPMQIEKNPLAQSLVASKHPELYRDLNSLLSDFQARLVNSLDRQLLEKSAVEQGDTNERLKELEMSLSESELVKTQLLTEKVEWQESLQMAEKAREELEKSTRQLSEEREKLNEKCKQLELEKSQLEEQVKSAIVPVLDDKMSIEQLKELENKLKNHLKDIKTLREKKVEELTKSQAQRKEEDNTCVICYERTKEMVFIPCGHICLCAKCGEGKTTCPICRAEGKAIKIFTV
eukprot:TRINITY_DN4897_c0_g1_i2.p1 TRINITY_DN4897_c0_g1~~TRINITY_DN4897_c0_g1_i2.p1  ORF type:complete len:720 (-),score=204.23 TRINITY_DN4897_c0_g1_i2:62-2221(-)